MYAIRSYYENQNQEMPRMDRNTVRLPRVKPMVRQVSVMGFQFTFSPGSAAAATGILV